jgi:hypothetical protein
MGGTARAISVAIFVLVFGLPEGGARAQSVGTLSPQCANIDFTSAQSLFECMGTIRHRNGASKFARMEGRRCAEIIQQLMREIGRIKAFRDETQPIPSCEIVADAAEMMTGNAPYWSACTGYPASDARSHMRRCMEAFAPAYYGTSHFPAQLATCEEFRRGYELALKFANNRHNQRVPEAYSPPPCDVVNQIIAGLTGAEPRWSGCTNYDPSNVREHLLACVGSSPQDFLTLRDCAAVRIAYEQRLRATYDGLPADYSVLSCGDAQAVLDKAAAHRRAEEAKRVARAEAAERERQAAIDRERSRVEAAREKILAERKVRRSPALSCDPGPNRYPDHEYGEVMTALETSCVRTLAPKAQLFLAGLGEELVRNCNLPRDAGDRMRIAEFVAASVQVAVGGGQYGNPDLGVMMGDQVASQTAYMTGAMTFRALGGCQSPAPEFAAGLARYLEHTAANSHWVDGCELQYATRYSRSQCQCMADKIRALDPAIHTKEFSRGSIQTLSNRNPILGLQMGMQCGVGDY